LDLGDQEVFEGVVHLVACLVVHHSAKPGCRGAFFFFFLNQLPWRFFIFFSYLKKLLSLRIVTDAELMIAAYRA
jgi:hypothetical protein